MNRKVRGLLIDLDGVLYVGGEPVPGAREAIAALAEMGIGCRFVTNTTTRTAAEVREKLRGLGFAVGEDEIFSAVTATRRFLQRQGDPKLHLLVRESVLPEFAEFRRTGEGERPDFVIVGDIGAAWSYPLMNRAFRELIDGARLIAMHKNKFFQTADGLDLDIGAFVAGLEYVTGRRARVIGKPSVDFFRLGIESLGLPPEEVAMVGDDIDSDVGGGQQAGMAGVLVKTGKYREAYVAGSGVEPDGVIESVAALPEWVRG